MITLYSGPLSLFSRKVEIALGEKQLAFDRIMVPFTQTKGYSPKNPKVLAVNPKGQVPVLIDGALEIYDSTVILEYLEEAYPTPPLYPSSPQARAMCRQLELFADEVMLPPLRAFMHRTEPRPADLSVWKTKEEATIKAGEALAQQFSFLENKLGKNQFFCGTFSVADIALFVSCLYAQRLGTPGFGKNVNLKNWYHRLCARPVFAELCDEINAADAELSAPVEGAFPDY